MDEESSSAAAAAAAENCADTPSSLFFTTTDLINKMNRSIQEATGAAGELPGGGGFELQRKLPDGSYRRADESETAAANFQAKMKQAAEMTASLEPGERIEWAGWQRKQGNDLFARGEYREAMDVYLTCLVAMDQKTRRTRSQIQTVAGTTANSTEQQLAGDDMTARTEKEIKLPVLLNLALSAMKLGLLSKADQFCTFAIETDSGRRSVKAHFRRGRVRMLMGHYVTAELDLEKADELNAAKFAEGGERGADEEAANERDTIARERRKLSRLVGQASRNQKTQKRAMERLFQSPADAGGGDLAIATEGLYHEKKTPPIQHALIEKYDESRQQLSCWQWYLHMVGRCAQKILDIIGEDEDDSEVEIPVDRDLLNALMDEKKNS
ncbi:hypothetical protein THAOC_34142 [Thalassiosira oceanica]|uniref:Uncharacterized protein n=1 Tax=Thalassiosira oceanica TaxID=159749 RepID=K0RKG0_THAOC|nr:hypothetical protein THAOC_34142 [Thalassiosira oceanica]|eukprot:EJK47162.1 hypothetical protein THAOC_34142 [Thalassiosira oceanica]